MAIGESYPNRIRMEESETYGRQQRRLGFRPPERTAEESLASDERDGSLLHQLLEERRAILDNEKLSSKDKRAFLEANRIAMFTAKGGTITKSENVVYAILVFATGVTIILAILNTQAALPTEVTMGFLGTTLGGTIATIGQKIGRL